MNKKYKILLVDDGKFLLDVFTKKYSDEGWKVKALNDARGDFVYTVAQWQPDIISLDILMPERDGFQALELLRADTRTQKIPVVFYTNLGQKEDIEKAKSLGADGYIISASATPQEVVNKVSEILERHRLSSN
ncbi:MAG: response regulator [Candidatus Vogelbacteria bacterium]